MLFAHESVRKYIVKEKPLDWKIHLAPEKEKAILS